MAYPPPVLATNRANSTPQVSNHPADHNTLAAGMNDTTAFLKPKTSNATIAAPFTGAFVCRRSGFVIACQVSLTRPAVTLDAPFTIAQLAAGFRPGPAFSSFGVMYYAVDGGNSQAGGKIAHVQIEDTGAVRVLNRVVDLAILRGDLVFMTTDPT